MSRPGNCCRGRNRMRTTGQQHRKGCTVTWPMSPLGLSYQDHIFGNRRHSQSLEPRSRNRAGTYYTDQWNLLPSMRSKCLQDIFCSRQLFLSQRCRCSCQQHICGMHQSVPCLSVRYRFLQGTPGTLLMFWSQPWDYRCRQDI